MCYDLTWGLKMTGVTVDISEEAYTLIRSTADQQGRTVGEFAEESLAIPSRDNVTAWVRESREGSPLSDDAALELAVAETRAHRQELHERSARQTKP